MANNDLLSEFSDSDIKEFKRDFTQIIKVGAEIDRYYVGAKQDLDLLIPKYEKLVEQFNRKYKGMKIKTEKTVEHFKVRLFVKEKDIKDFFANSASKIPSLKSVGSTNFNQVDISDAEKFARFLDSLFDKIFISYLDVESGTSTVVAMLRRNEKMVEVIYSPQEIVNENSAGFKVCVYYALKQGYDKKIDVYSTLSTFGFTNLLDEVEKREWFDKFNPRFLE